ncbi:MAG: TlpA family protein disulfide reductase [Candidatus Rokuibacteriota bacterium]
MKILGQIVRSSPVAGVLLLLGVVGVAPVRSASDPFAAMAVDQAGLPVPAPDVAFRSLEGREVRLRELRGRVVLLGFFTTS